MKRGIVILISVVVLIILGVAGYLFYYYNYMSHEGPILDSCRSLGCPEGSIYVGSVNSDKYYECDCHYAQRILPENIVCFSSDEEAESAGRIKSEC